MRRLENKNRVGKFGFHLYWDRENLWDFVKNNTSPVYIKYLGLLAALKLLASQ